MANTPSGVAVDKPGNVYVSVREGDRGVIWKYTPDGTPSFSRTSARRRSMDSPSRPTAKCTRRWRRPDPREGSTGWTARGMPSGSRERGHDPPDGLAFDDRGTLYVTESFSMSAAGYARAESGASLRTAK